MLKITVRQVGTRDFPTEANVVQPVVRDLAQVVYDETQAGADKHTVTRALFQSVFNRSIPHGRSVGHDTGRAPHAEFVLFGTPPHKIRPKNRKILRWGGPGGYIFARVVNHPGYKGDHYLNDAARIAVARFEEILSRYWRG